MKGSYCEAETSVSERSEPKLIDDICKIQEEFYTASRRNLFQWRGQKQECAEAVSTQVPLDELVKNTIYTVSPRKWIEADDASIGIYVDYPMFKTFATPSNYETIIAHLLAQMNRMIRRQGMFNIHINLRSFSMSAAERYNSVIQMFCNECCKNDTQYIRAMKNMYIYHTPTMMQTISSMLVRFTNETIKEKIVFYSRDESVLLLDDLVRK